MAIVKKYKAEVSEITSPVEGIYVVSFSSDKKFKYKAGQFLHLALDEYNPSLQWPDSRCFSVQSSPKSKDIKITFSVKGKFTQRMAEELKIGAEVTLKLPYGSLFSNVDNSKKYVFIAGGTGVTPYLSLFTDEAFKDLSSARLYLGLRENAHNLYESDLQESKRINDSFQIDLVYQDESGILDIEKILNENEIDSTYFISGPPVMIKNFKEFLIGKNVPVENVLTDDWE